MDSRSNLHTDTLLPDAHTCSLLRFFDTEDKSFSLSGVLHDLECLLWLYALMQQVGHDTVTCSDYV